MRACAIQRQASAFMYHGPKDYAGYHRPVRGESWSASGTSVSYVSRLYVVRNKVIPCNTNV